MKFLDEYRNMAPVVLRWFLGIAFIVAGLDKIMSLEMATGMFQNMLGAGWLVYVAIIIELLGGLALLMGKKVREAAAVLALLILVAFIVTFKTGTAPHFIGTLREVMVMNTGGGNTAVNFMYFGALIATMLWGEKR